jgi:hypothetical protein
VLKQVGLVRRAEGCSTFFSSGDGRGRIRVGVPRKKGRRLLSLACDRAPTSGLESGCFAMKVNIENDMTTGGSAPLQGPSRQDRNSNDKNSLRRNDEANADDGGGSGSHDEGLDGVWGARAVRAVPANSCGMARRRANVVRPGEERRQARTADGRYRIYLPLANRAPAGGRGRRIVRESGPAGGYMPCVCSNRAVL